jgi:YihY family inner membrane protein
MRGIRSLGPLILDTLEQGLSRLPRPLAVPLAVTIRVLLGAARAFEAKRLQRDAAFLAYFGLLSLIPFLTLLVWVVGVLAAPVIADPERLDGLRTSILGATEHAFPFLADQVTGFLSEATATSGAGGILGLVAMFVTAGLLFRALSMSISDVYDQERPRGFLGARVVAAVSILAAGVVTLGLLMLREALQGLMEGYGIQWYLPLGPEATLLTVVEILVVVTGFLVTVRVSTRGRMRNRPLLLAGALFWLSWALAARLFGLYLERVPTLSRVYGPLTAAAALLVWTYYTAVMFLFCVCVAAEIGKIEGPAAG